IPVRMARPGPFHVRSRGIFSRKVTVRIHPFLDTSLVGPRVAGAPLHLRARLRPPYAGGLRVRVLRPGRKTFPPDFGSHTRVPLDTTALQRFRVAIEALPRRGFANVSRSLHVSLRPPFLQLGASGGVVGELARRLRALNYAVPASPGSFDGELLE